ncbi:hypothetical protein GBF38_021885, partial [Nibea albiflora]
MGKPLSRPGCFRKSSCCLEKHGAGDGGVGGRAGGMEGGYGDGYVPQRSIYDTMCINQQIDSHHHHPGGSVRRDCVGEGSFSYSASGSLRVSRSPADMFDPQPRSLTPNPSFVRRLDERAIYDSLKLGGQDADGGGCHSPGRFNRSVSPSVSSFSAPGVSSSSKKHHHHHQHHHGDSTKSRDGRHSWKVLTPPQHLECLELTTTEIMDRGGGYLNPGHYPPPGGQSSSLTSPLISPFSGSPLSSGYHTPVFFSPAKPRPSQTQSLRCSPPQVIQPRHYSQTQSLRLSPPQELRRSPYRAPLVQLSAHDLEQDLRERGGGWGRNEREREWEREREREMERGWAQREWERERERGRLERERARERERRETSTFGTFGYGRPVPLRSDRDSVFLEPDLDTTPLLLPQPSPSPSPSAAPRMGTGAVEEADNKTVDVDKIESSHVEKVSRSRKSKSSKSSSRTRPGTATGIRPGAASPRLSKGLGDLESTGPAEGIESTWPRRLIVRKRTVRQGGALHNLPILPPLPSVLSALEKRRPLGLLHHRPGHYSENPLTNLINASSIVGRCSLKEPSHPEPGAGLVGRASLKEQNLEHWRVCREQEEPRRSRSREKQGEQIKEKTEAEERMGEEEKREKEWREEKDKREEKVCKEKERITGSEGAVEETKREKSERRVEGKVQEDRNKKESDVQIKCEQVEVKEMKIKHGIQEQHGQELEEVVVKLKPEEGEVEEGEGDTFGEEGGMESWDAVLEMVTTLWDDGWEKGGAGGGGDTDSFSGSLQRWPLLRPPIGFGGSHPPSSAASELSLTELERRARELDSDLEHLDLSQPHRDTQDLYQTLLEPQRERADMYQTHPGPQRDKAALLTGVGSRSQVSLELSSMASPATDTDRSPADWSAKSAGTSTVGPSSTKEDSSPDSNLTLESDSSGIFLSLSNQSQEEAGSDSDQPISGSDLGSSSTSLEKDGDDGGLKEWGREESTELQWCYPSLLNTSQHEDAEGDGEREEAGSRDPGEDEETEKDENGRRVGKMVSIKTPLDDTDMEDSPLSEDTPPRKKVTLMRGDSPLPLSPSKQPIKHFLEPNQKPIRSSGLDCGDLDPFVQSDSFVYLAVSARPASRDVNICCLLCSSRDSDSESSGSGPVDLSVLGCGSVAGDSDWDSDLSDSDPSRSSRISAASNKSAGIARPKRLPAEMGWDLFGETTEPEVLSELFREQDRNNNGKARKVTGVTTSMAATQAIPMATQPATTPVRQTSTVEQSSTTKKVTWQFKPAQRSVCTGSRKEKEKEVTSSSSVRFTELGGGETH